MGVVVPRRPAVGQAVEAAAETQVVVDAAEVGVLDAVTPVGLIVGGQTVAVVLVAAERGVAVAVEGVKVIVVVQRPIQLVTAAQVVAAEEVDTGL